MLVKKLTFYLRAMENLLKILYGRLTGNIFILMPVICSIMNVCTGGYNEESGEGGEGVALI